MGYTSDFNNGVTYNTADINAVRQSLMTNGVINELNTSLQVVNNGTGSVKVLGGQAIFIDGSRIMVDASGVILSVIGSGKNYVYVKRDANSASVNISTDAPTGDYITLAEVTGSTIVDKRSYSSFKVMRGLGNGYFVKKNISLNCPVTSEWKLVHSENVGTHLFKYAIVERNTPAGTGEWYYAYFDFDLDILRGFSRRYFSNGALGLVTDTAQGAVISAGTNYLSDTYLKLVYIGNTIQFWIRGVYAATFDVSLQLA